MFNFKPAVVASFAALVGIVGLAQPAQAEVALTYAFYAPSSTFPAAQMQQWKKDMDQCTDGAVDIQLYPGGTLLGAKDMYDGVLHGIADIGLGTPTNDPKRFPLGYGMSLPVGFQNATVASMTYWDLLHEFKPKALDKFKIITAFTTEPGYLQSRTSIRSLDDISGKKLRANGPLYTVMQKLGADPVAMPMSDVPQAIQTGVIDGIVTSREILYDLKLAKSLHSVTDYPTGVYTFVAAMSKSRWKTLPEPVQKCIDKLGPKMAKWTGHYHDDDVQHAMKWAESEQNLKFVELEKGQKDAWDAHTKSMVAHWLAKHENDVVPAKKFLHRLKELKAKYAKLYQEGKL